VDTRWLHRHLDERQRRLLLGSEAAELGRGGIKALAEDPMSQLVWTIKSTRNLAGALTAMGHPVSDRPVGLPSHFPCSSRRPGSRRLYARHLLALDR